MLTEVYPKVYRNEIPLPNFPLKTINSYIIVSEQRNIIVDTGFNTEAGRAAILKGIRELNIDLKKTDLILTHMHPDHAGMALFLQKLGATVYIGQTDRELLNSIILKEAKAPFEALAEMLSFEKEIFPSLANLYGDNSTKEVVFHPLREGDTLSIGDYVFEVVNTPGHTPGHIGLYERKHKLFFCGDHILDHISPSVMFWGFEQDALGIYMKSLAKVYSLNVKLLFTGHFDLITNHRKRIKELISLCEERIQETKDLMGKGNMTPHETAANLHWNIKEKWEDFSKMQRFMAVSETLTHLEHLTHKKNLKRCHIKGTLYYELNKI